VLVVSAIAALLAAACGGGDGGGNGSASAPVRIAAFGFTESRVLAELYGQALEAKGFAVRRAVGLSSREVIEPALEQGLVDVVPEYTGTVLEFLNKGAGQATADPDASHRLLIAAFARRGVTVLDAADAQDQNALAVTRATADRLRLSKVSDLQASARTLVFGGPPECPGRRFCLPGLERAYGLQFREFRPLDAAGPLTVGALEGHEIDVGLLFTTSPQVKPKGFLLLADDHGLQPAENVVPVVRTAVARRLGARLTGTLDAVSAELTTAALVDLNGEVDLRGREPAAVARGWLVEHGLVARR
jgi:osmoprotectant transport system substrate-binding protein